LAHHLKGEDAQGLPDAENAVALGSTDPYHYWVRAEIYEKLGRRDAAIADYRMALTFDPKLQTAKDGLKRLQGTP
jgi:Tfp pilus assembly protein PilF